MKEDKVKVYLQNLKSEEVKKRIEAVSHLHIVAKSFGVTKTINQLIPFIKEFEDEDEEVLLQLGEQLYLLGKYVSAHKEALTKLISYFYILLSYEDLSVLNVGMVNLKKLIREYMGNSDVLFSLVKKLCSLGFPKALIGASRIYCELTDYIPQKYLSQFKKILSECVKCSTAIVRKEIAITLRYIFVDGNPLETIALNGLQLLLDDKLDTVKVHALESLMANEHSVDFFMKNVYPLVVKSTEFKNWRIRFVIAKSLPKLLISSSEQAKEKFIGIYLALLSDNEFEVTEQALINLKTSCEFIGAEVLADKFMPILIKIAKSDEAELKVALAGSILYFAPLFAKTDNMDKIKEILAILLEKNDSNINVQLLKNHQPLGDVLSTSNLINLLNPVMRQLLIDQDWKIREKNVEAYEIYLTKLGKHYCSSEGIVEDLKNTLRDRIFIIRQKIIKMIVRLCKNFGQEWTEKYGLKVFSCFAKHHNYLLRLNYLFGLSKIFTLLDDSVLLQELKTAYSLVNDKVPNVRYNLIILLLRIAMTKKNEAFMTVLKKAIKELENDQDSDIITVLNKIKSSDGNQVIISELVSDYFDMV